MSQPSPADNNSTASTSDKSAAKLPFEPSSSKVKTPKMAASKVAKASTKPQSGSVGTATVPEAVSKRMVKRMTFFSGIPTLLGMMTFVISYFIVKQGGVKLPTSAVLLVSLGFFGLGVLGLSYGILSASWEEDQPGSLLGFEQFGVNFARVRTSIKEAKAK
jgi:hypothetical protein